MRIFPIIPIWLMLIISLILIILILIFKKSRATIYEIGIIILLFIINLRIMFPTDSSNIIVNDLDVLFVIDNTISMYAEDYGSNNTERIEAVKQDCQYIIKELSGARFALITFNNSSKIDIPYTFDTNIVNESIDILQPMISYYAKGSSLNTPYNDMKNVLSSPKQGEKRKKIVFFISDGEITDDSKLKSYSKLDEYIDSGAVLGYGTTKGGYMKQNDGYSNEIKYVEDTSSWPYKKAVSKLDEDNLESIAEDLNLEYIHMDKQSNIDKTLKEVKKSVNSKSDDTDLSSYTDIYYIFTIPLFILLILLYNEYKRRSL